MNYNAKGIGCFNMENNLDAIKNLVSASWRSSWAFAIRRVLFQWITSIVLMFIGLWTIQALFSFSIARIFDLIPDSLRFLIYNNIHTISNVCICGIAFVVILQVRSKNKYYKELFYLTELPFNMNKSLEEKLQNCKLGIIYCEGYKETLLFEKGIIQSCSPIPIVTALLGYVIEKVGLTNFDWHVYVVICIFIILIYVFLCLRNIRKFKENQWKINRLQEAKMDIETMKKKFDKQYITTKP